MLELGFPLFSKYLEQVGPNCPFLGQSLNHGTLYVREISIAGVDNISDIASICVEAQKDVHAYFLHSGCVRRRINYVCSNIVLNFPCSNLENTLGEAYLGFAHEILREVFFSSGMMFGKFWLHETIWTDRGNYIGPCPLSFLSIRSVIYPNDLKFCPAKGEMFAENCSDSVSGVKPNYPILNKDQYWLKADQLTKRAAEDLKELPSKRIRKI